jgi:hypothetical protein
MKKVLLSFLMLLMLTPGLACAMPSCVHHEEEIQASADKPCHDEAGHHDKHHGPITNADCAKTDLQSVGDQVIKKPELTSQIFIPAILQGAVPEPIQLADNSKIRGPPPEWTRLSHTSPSTLLITQRVRL